MGEGKSYVRKVKNERLKKEGLQIGSQIVAIHDYDVRPQSHDTIMELLRTVLPLDVTFRLPPNPLRREITKILSVVQLKDDRSFQVEATTAKDGDVVWQFRCKTPDERDAWMLYFLGNSKENFETRNSILKAQITRN